MDALTIAAASGLRARMESLEMLANNLANVSTPGYKGDREFYTLYWAPEAAEPLREDGQPAALPLIDRPWTDFREGAIEMTGNPMDLAIRGRGFFVVEAPGGPLYTRNGSLRLSPAGVLTTAAGHPLRRAGGGVIQALSAAPLEVAPDGTVQQQGVVLGRIEVVDFPDLSVLRKLEGGQFRAQSGAAAAPAPGVEISQGRLEGSNVSAAEGAVRLVGVMRQFEMLQRAITLGAEMNRKAIEEVARVAS